MMARYRSLISCLLAAIALFVVSCSTPTEVAAPSYTDADIAQIKAYVADIDQLRDRLNELPDMVDTARWSDVDSLIHGPLGELRFKMTSVARTLDQRVQADARDISKEVFNHLIAIDEAVTAQNRERALLNYNGILEDIERFVQLTPVFPRPGDPEVTNTALLSPISVP
ncbi:MAG: photosystem II protein PsbQ [Elainellaceae cyanobacterium]